MNCIKENIARQKLCDEGRSESREDGDFYT